MFELVKLEKITLLKGWLVSILIVFPFTFLPVISGEGTRMDRLVDRAPLSLAYSAGFSVFLVRAAVYQNYTRQNKKLRYFHRAAFSSLNFRLATEGKGSILRDFNAFLLGTFGERFVRIDIEIDLEEAENNEVVLRVIPPASGSQGVTTLPLNKIHLDDPQAIRKYLSVLVAG
jgi:hypothetical protein